MEKILYINSPKNDFLADSFLIGLKSLYPDSVYEWPRNKFIYKVPMDDRISSMHGIGFTLYNLLDPDTALEYEPEMKPEEFDLIIFGDIYRQEKEFRKLQPFLHFQNTLMLDGEDTPALFPYYYPPWKKPWSFTFPRLEKKFIYMKREILPARTNYYRYFKLIPGFLAEKIPLPRHLLPISFSIPDEKILVGPGIPKRKDFPKHIVDPEVCAAVPGSVSSYAFGNEADYYKDLQESRFGITTKRGGWDCLRHYEIAANGAVPCFRNMKKKPDSCAPHGLKDGINCLTYENREDLRNRIESLRPEDYERLRRAALEWAKQFSCTRVAADALQHFSEKVQELSG
jgi:hypothetical protein